MRMSSGTLAAFVALAMTSGAARADHPMSYLHTFGPAADPSTRLNWGLIAISVAVVVIIALLVLWGTLRRRAPLGRDSAGRLPVAAGQDGLSWITVGVGISVLVLIATTVWTVRTLAAVGVAPTTPALTIRITAHQWWWQVEYESDSPQDVFATANEIHVPVNEPVELLLDSDDVIHSFWIPKLAGKTDVIPGQTNRAWLQANAPGLYRGQCGEYCGAQHAHMAMHVVAQSRAEFDAWLRQQRQPAAPIEAEQAGTEPPPVITAAAPPAEGQSPAQTGQATRSTQMLKTEEDARTTRPLPPGNAGAALFLEHCAVCHTVRGTSARGRLGPDLTHLMSRRFIGAGVLPNQEGTLLGWVANAQGVKPGARMPPIPLSPNELHAVVGYLQTLK